MFASFEGKFQQLQFGRKKQQEFLEDFHSLLIDGVPASTAIETIAEVSASGEKLVALTIARCLAQGQQIADGMQDWFAPSIVELIRAGENSGSLDQTLASAIDAIKQKNHALIAFVNAMAYPLVVIIVACLMIVFITDSVLADFAEIKPITNWPEVGRVLMHAGQFVQHWWLLVVSAIGAVICCIALLLQRSTGEFRHILDDLPVLSLYRRFAAARFMETLGLLISNGIVLKQALAIMQANAQPYYAWHLLMMEYRLSSGTDNVADVLNTSLLNEADLIRLRVVARGNKGFERALISLGRQAAKRNIKQIVYVGRVFGTSLLVLAALLAAMTIFGIYSVGSVLTV